MRRFLLAFGALVVGHCANAQQETLSWLTAKPQPTLDQKVSATGDTVALPFFDDFSNPGPFPDSRKWQDQFVWVNGTMGIDVYTVGVATLDGLDQFGQPYGTSNLSDTLADVLTSRFIQVPANANGVFLSFFYQLGGNGERPAQGDTLVVDFWSPLQASWTRIWKAEPDTVNGFRQVMLPVDSAKWKLPGFRFRIGAFGAQNGAFDCWNIDYVRLSANRTPGDTGLTDPAFTRPHPSVLKNFQDIPWFHFQDTATFVPSFTLHYRKNGPTGSANLNLRRYILSRDGVNFLTQNGNPFNTDPYNVENALPVNLVNFNLTPPPGGPFKLKITSVMDGANDGIRKNDTIFKEHHFENWYAFDDGSAERAYGIKNLAGAQMALRFSSLQADTLKGIYLNFAHAGVNAQLNGFKIGIWTVSNGIPGSLIYLSDSIYKPVYYGHNEMVAYALDTPGVYLNGPVFIGVKQTTVQPLNIGFDVNTPGPEMYYGSPGNWFISLVEGTPMLRPYFQYQPANLGTVNKEPLIARFGPNPFADRLILEFHEYQSYEVYNGLGQLMAKGSGQNVQLETAAWPSGMYVLRTVLGEAVATEKLIKY